MDDFEVDKTLFGNPEEALNNEKWKEFVNSVKEKEGGFGDELKEELKDWLKEEVNPFGGSIDDHLQWKLGFKGQILMSDQREKTASFDGSHNLVPSTNTENATIKAITDFLKTI